MTVGRNGDTPARRVVAVPTVRNRRETALACLRGAFSPDAPGTELRAVVVTCLRFLASRLYTGYGTNPVSRSPAGSLP